MSASPNSLRGRMVLVSILRQMDEGRTMPSLMLCPRCGVVTNNGPTIHKAGCPYGFSATATGSIRSEVDQTPCPHPKMPHEKELLAMEELWRKLASLDRGARWRALQWLQAKHEATKD